MFPIQIYPHTIFYKNLSSAFWISLDVLQHKFENSYIPYSIDNTMDGLQLHVKVRI